MSNRGRRAVSEINAEDAVGAFRVAYGDLLGLSVAAIVYRRSATQLTYDFSRHLANQWNAGYEIVVTRLDHDANVTPWIQAAAATDAKVRWIDFDPQTSEVDLDSVEQAITDRTRLVAVTAASNLIGTKPQSAGSPTPRMPLARWSTSTACTTPRTSSSTSASSGRTSSSARRTNSSAPHCGVLAATPDLLDTLRPDKLVPSTNDVPERFEFGTAASLRVQHREARACLRHGGLSVGEPHRQLQDSTGCTRDTSRSASRWSRWPRSRCGRGHQLPQHRQVDTGLGEQGAEGCPPGVPARCRSYQKIVRSPAGGERPPAVAAP